MKELILTVSTLQGLGSLEKTEFNSFLLCKGVVVLKELILTLSTLGKCGSHEKINLTVSSLQGCGGIESPGFNSFYFARVWQSRKN